MLLTKHTNEIYGTVKFLFQPAEEHGGRGGAKPMIEDGAMENPKVDFIFGLHIGADRPSNVFGLRGGPIMAAPDTFKITIKGKGGHGSQPHKTIDPIFISAQVITALQGVLRADDGSDGAIRALGLQHTFGLQEQHNSRRMRGSRAQSAPSTKRCDLKRRSILST